MKYHSRLLENKLERMAQLFPVVVLGGARQSGKSTLLNHLFGDIAQSVIFDPVTDIGEARRDPELFLRLNPPPIILDEVQFAPELLPALKREVDKNRDQKGLYFLTGSQQLNLIRKVEESLAGRAFICDLLPMSRGELAGNFHPGLLEILLGDGPVDNAEDLLIRLSKAAPFPSPRGNLLERMFIGGYPGLLEFEIQDAPNWHSSYLRTYVERDIRVLRALSDPQDFGRFVRLLAALNAQEVNYSHLGREVGIIPRTARAWLDVLVASYQVVLLNAYSGNAVKRVSGRPKAHFVDTGLVCYLLSISSPQALSVHPNLGSVFESYVVSEILKQASSLSVAPKAWHWRAGSGAEVDLVLERDGILFPIEIKLSSRPTRRDLSGIRSFAKTYATKNIGPQIVVHGGADLYMIDEKTAAVPVDMV